MVVAILGSVVPHGRGSAVPHGRGSATERILAVDESQDNFLSRLKTVLELLTNFRELVVFTGRCLPIQLGAR